MFYIFFFCLCLTFCTLNGWAYVLGVITSFWLLVAAVFVGLRVVVLGFQLRVFCHVLYGFSLSLP